MSSSKLMSESRNSSVATLRALATAIESGEIEKYEISQSSDGSVVVKADSVDGNQRMIQTKSEMDGFTESTTTHIEKQAPKKRRKNVLKMVKNKMTQIQIAEKTMVSQKTISNDIKKLRKKGKL